MSILLELAPEIEQELQAQANAHGVSLADYAREILAQRAAHRSPAESPGDDAKNLYELLTPVRGLLTDDEIDLYFGRSRLPSRVVDLG